MVNDQHLNRPSFGLKSEACVPLQSVEDGRRFVRTGSNVVSRREIEVDLETVFIAGLVDHGAARSEGEDVGEPRRGQSNAFEVRTGLR